MADEIKDRLNALWAKIEARGVPKCIKCGQEQLRAGTCADCNPTRPVGPAKALPVDPRGEEARRKEARRFGEFEDRNDV